MDVEMIRTLRDALQYSSISEAARRCYCSQQTMSKRIASLEKELGAALVRREPVVAPTPAGKAFLRHADTILNEYDSMLDDVRTVARRPAGEFRMHRFRTNTFGVIATGLTNALVRDRQNISLVWVTENEDDALLVREGRLDAGFVHAVEKDGVSCLRCEPDMEYLGLSSVTYPLSFVVRDGNPALDLESPSLAELVGRFGVEIPSFASKGALVRCIVELLDHEGLPHNLVTVYCDSNVGYFGACDDEGLTLQAGSGVFGFSPGGREQGYRTIVPADADYRITSYVMYLRGNDNPCLPYVLDAIARVDEGLRA